MKKYYISPETVMIPVEEILTANSSANYEEVDEHSGDKIGWNQI